MGVMVVASIVAGEVGTTVPEARMLVACQVVQDAEEGRRIGPPRWNGWGVPTAADVRAATLALTTDACERLPDCRLLGGDADVKLWRRLGYVDAEDAIYRIARDRWAANCVMARGWEDFFKRLGGPTPR